MVVLSSFAIHLVFNMLWKDVRFIYEPLHSTVEAIGAVAAIFVAIILLRRTKEEYGQRFFLLAMGLLGMGLLDGFHAVSSMGNGFVLLHSMGSLIGGLWFSLICLPIRTSETDTYWNWKRFAPWITAGFCILFSIWTINFRETLPVMSQGGHFAASATIINLTAGILFAISTVRFIIDFRRFKSLELFLFICMSMLFCVAELSFPFSAPWDVAWWWWHALRLTAYILVLGVVFYEHTLSAEALEKVRDDLDVKVKERTAELLLVNEQLHHEIGVRKQAEEERLESHEKLKKAYDDLKSAQSQILQQEKMASIGQLAAGIAHEINNPTGYILSNLNSLGKYAGRYSEFISLLNEAVVDLADIGEKDANVILDKLEQKRKALKLDYVIEDTRQLIQETLDGGERIKRIVQDLKSFSHVDEAEYKAANINEGLESTINIAWNELKYKATVKKEFGDIPLTKCNPGQLNQVFMNILVNAAHAIEKQGEITIKTWDDGDYVYVSIADTGSGIPGEQINRIFEPFYTTKDVGKGTGLGLSIAYDIVKKHAGEIAVVSEVDTGTTFTIKIPRAK